MKTQKLRRDILEQRIEKTEKKILETSAAQTSPRLSRSSPIITDAINVDPVKFDAIETATFSDDVSQPARLATPPNPAVRTVIQPKPVKLVAEQPKPLKEESDDPSISSLLDTEDEKEQTKVPRQR